MGLVVGPLIGPEAVNMPPHPPPALPSPGGEPPACHRLEQPVKANLTFCVPINNQGPIVAKSSVFCSKSLVSLHRFIRAGWERRQRKEGRMVQSS